jgi:cold shock CspA family protein
MSRPTDVYDVIDEVIENVEHGDVIGNCKWFNKKLGYGFITVYTGENKGRNIFVHHSGIKPLNSHFKTLRKGEYVHFNVIEGTNGPQAVSVTGICGGPLMCDNIERRDYKTSEDRTQFSGGASKSN